MKKEQVKAAAKKASAKAEQVTDSLLTRLVASPATWAVVLVWTVAAIAVGKFLL
jgi:hypothetical protein